MVVVEGLIEGREVVVSLVHFTGFRAVDRCIPLTAKSTVNGHVGYIG